MATSFLDAVELSALGLAHYGSNVLISRKASLYSTGTICLGDNVRIDDFCILSGNVTIGSYVHISAYAAIYAPQPVMIDDYAGMSPRATIYSATDDFTADCLINPIVPEEMRRIIQGPVHLCRCVQIGTSSIVMPGVSIGEGSTVGALSLVKRDLEPWGVFAGNPLRKIKARSNQQIISHINNLENP